VVERGADPQVHPVRRFALRAAQALTNPLRPDDYIELMNPLWTTRELRGEVVRVQPETVDASTVVIRPSFPWPGHEPGQYLRIGVEINGIRHWRAYSLTSDPDHPEGLISITVKTVETGKLSTHFTKKIKAGEMVFLGDVEGTFQLPKPTPKKVLLISAGSGITPIWAMMRDLERRGALTDAVHVNCNRTPELAIFGEQLREMDASGNGYRLIEHLSSEKGRITPADLDEIVPDWRDRETFLSGPRELIDAMIERWEADGDPEKLRLERFQPVIGQGDAEVGSGGTVRFRVTDFEATCEQGISILVGGEDAGGTLPFGCRMGICHTCVGRLQSGQLRDLRTGDVFGEEGQMVRTCVNAPEGHVEIDL
jgi:stearoyl-CoA 9-desaturase NADPH oxidoreductase